MADLKRAWAGSTRTSRLIILALLVHGFCGPSQACAQLKSRPSEAPPPAPPIVRVPPLHGTPGPKPLGITPYSIGQPTDQEQLYLEYLNRMRTNPVAEGQRLATTTDPDVLSAYSDFSVDLNLMLAQFATNPPVAPLAMNAQLLAAARWHSSDMLANAYQGHFQTNGSIVMDPGDRIKTNGYKPTFYGENVFSYADSVFHGHAAFAVDWGNGPGGMQTPPGHRDNMLFAQFREVGIGVTNGVNGMVGPQLVTQDFGTQTSDSPFITGVVYFDLNGNGFYNIGEGVGGVTVNTPGSSFFTTTADSGGYSLPVPADGTYTLTFTAPGLSNQIVATVSGSQNTKIDYSPVYNAPMISGPNPAALNQNNSYSFTGVAAATSYQWQEAQLSAYNLVDGGENGLTNVTVSVSPGYSVVSTDFAASGTHSFNLAHSATENQTMQLKAVLLIGANSVLSFADRLGYAFSNEVAQAQISLDEGSTWKTVWSEPGNDGNNPVDTAFVNRTVPLAAYAGQLVQVRFVYAYSSGFYFPPSKGVGLYLDNIAVSNAQQVNGTVISTIASGRSFDFAPTVITNYMLAVRAQINSRTLPWGPALPVAVTTQTAKPSIELVSAPVLSGTQVQIDFTVANYQTGMTFQLFLSGYLSGAWTQDASATLQTLVTNSRFRFTTSTSGSGNQFFRVRGS